MGSVPVTHRAILVIKLERGGVRSMRNPLDESSAAQSLDGNRLKGSLHVPAAGFIESASRTQAGSSVRGSITIALEFDARAFISTVSGSVRDGQFRGAPARETERWN